MCKNLVRFFRIYCGIFFSLFITFVFRFITPFRLYDVFAQITYIWSSFCDTGVGVAHDDMAIKFWPWLFLALLLD